MTNEVDEVVDYSLLEKSISQDFGLDVKNLQGVQIGYSNKVYKGNLGKDEVYVRMHKDKSLYPVEAAIYRVLDDYRVPVPKILALDTDPRNLGYATMIIESAKGEPLNEAKLSPNQRIAVYENCGQVLRRMHNIKLPSFGQLSLDDGQLVGEYQTYPEYMKAGDNGDSNFRYAGEHNIITRDEYKKVLEIWKKISNLSVDQAVLSHNDFHEVHVFTDGKRVTGVIDFTDAMGEDPRWDIAMAMFFQNREEREAFKKGYGKLASDPIVQDYLVFVAVCKVGWRHKKGYLENTRKALKVFREELKQ